MMTSAAIGLVALLHSTGDVYRLEIGPPDRKTSLMVVNGPGLYDMRRGAACTMSDLVAAANGVSFVLVGESHDRAEHHLFQADIIRALCDAGRNVVVGMEMFPASSQSALNLWSLGRLREEQFIDRSNWKTVWGFDYALYRPIFDVVRERKLRLVGLNVPREAVRAVARSGVSALESGDYGDVRELDLTNREHRLLFDTMLGGAAGHGMGDNVYAGQVLWDTAMAHNALKYWARTPRTRDTIMVIVAGSGHVMYGLGINYRLSQRTAERVLSVVCLDAPEEGLTLTRSIADFVFVTSAGTRSSSE